MKMNEIFTSRTIVLHSIVSIAKFSISFSL